MKSTVLQIPMSKTLREKAEKAAEDMGFSSLQEVTRLFLKKLSEKKLKIDIRDIEKIELSPNAIKRYEKMYEDIQKGRNVYKPKNKKEFFEILNS